MAHEVVYTSQEQHAIYDEMSTMLFVNGYLTVMRQETEVVKGQMLQHFQKLMDSVWLHQLKQGRATWGDESKKLKP